MNKPVDYPIYYYEFIRRVSLFCVPTKVVEYSEIENLALGGLLFLGEDKFTGISNKTYSSLWGNLRFAIENKRDDIIFQYWSNAHQYKGFWMSEYSKDIDRIDKNRFVEFHIALGALLFYKERFESLKSILYYSNSLPPKYELYPINSTDIFLSLDKFLSFNREYIFIESKYPFPEKNGAGASDYIKTEIAKYLILLLIRELSLPQYYTYDNHSELPTLPITENDLYNWKENILPFIRNSYIELWEIIERNELVYDCITINIFEDYLNEIELAIEVKYKKTLENQPISIDKENEFKQNTTNIINNKIAIIKGFNQIGELSKDPITSNYKIWFKQIVAKGAFANDQHISYSGIDSSCAEYIVFNFYSIYSSIFLLHTKKTYMLKEEDIFSGIDKLVSSNSKFIIIACRTNIDYWASIEKGITKEVNYFYNNIEIVDLWNSHPNLYQTFYIIERVNLPRVNFNEPQEDEIKKYKLDDYDKEINLFGKLVDLNERKDLHIDIPNQKEQKEEYAIACLYLTPCIEVNQKTKVIEFKVFDKFDNKGVPNAISDVKSWDELFPKKEEKEEDK